MSTIDQMCNAALMRCTETINRSAGQHSRHILAGFVTAWIRMTDGFDSLMPKTEPEKAVHSDVDGGNFYLPDIDCPEQMTWAETVFFWSVVGICCGVGYVTLNYLYQLWSFT